MRTRSNKVTVYLNDQELQELNAIVDRTLLNREQFLRALVAGVTTNEAPLSPLWQTVCRMKRAAEGMKKIADTTVIDSSIEADLRKADKDVRLCVEEVTRVYFPKEHGESD